MLLIIVPPNYRAADWWMQPQPIGTLEEDKPITDAPLIFSEGYNCRIVADGVDSLVFFGVEEAGLGVVAENLPKGHTHIGSIIVNEEPPSETIRTDGLLLDSLIMRRLGNATGQNVLIEHSGVITVRPEEAEHAVFIGIGNLNEKSC
jgi:hypothetical protein